MHAEQVLAREGRQHKKAEAWVRGEAAHALGPAQSESLLAQLKEMRGGAEGTPAQPSTPTNAPSRSPQQRVPDSPPKAASAFAATPVRSEEHAAPSLPWQSTAGKALVQSDAQPSGSADRATGDSPSDAATTSLGAAGSAGAAGEGRSWAGLGQIWPASVRLRLAQLWQHMQSGEALGEWDQSQLAAAALGGAVLLYAAIAERRALGLGLRRWVVA